MGKGDKKTKRGKIIKGSYGKLRPKKKGVVSAALKAATKEKPEKKVAPKKEQEKIVVADVAVEVTEAKEETATEEKPKAAKKAPAKKTAEPKEKKAPAKKA